MTQEDQTPFISVPVPSQYVPQVYAYLAELTGTAPSSVSPVRPAGTGSTADSPDDGKLPIVQWTVEDFRKLLIEPLGSVQTVARALDILAKQPETRVSYTSLASQLGMEKGTFRATSRPSRAPCTGTTSAATGP